FCLASKRTPTHCSVEHPSEATIPTVTEGREAQAPPKSRVLDSSPCPSLGAKTRLSLGPSGERPPLLGSSSAAAAPHPGPREPRDSPRRWPPTGTNRDPRRRAEAVAGAGRAGAACLRLSPWRGWAGPSGAGPGRGRWRFRCLDQSRCSCPILRRPHPGVAPRTVAWRSAAFPVVQGTWVPQSGPASPSPGLTRRHGTGTDEESILTLLTSRSNAQRQEISAAFKTLFGRDLLDDLKSELTGKFEKLIVALMKPSRLYDAYELKHALKGAGTDEKVLTEIIASRTPEELRAIKEVYEEEYGSSLEDDVVGDTSGYYQRMLVVLLQANRDPDAGIDEAQVEQDAQALFQAGELKWGTDEEKFITIFGTRSVSHLRKVFDKYMTISGFQIEETIDRETSGNLEQLLLAVVKSIRSIPAYLAETLYYAMKGAGTDDHTLIRVMVSRSEIDLLNIRKEFRKNFATSLYSMIKGDTSGDYKKALLLLCGGED
uniref:Annexin n=1 Tax=Papio anubis TaxID=9555 RepID=A0A2I3N4M0_PAPAN